MGTYLLFNDLEPTNSFRYSAGRSNQVQSRRHSANLPYGTNALSPSLQRSFPNVSGNQIDWYPRSHNSELVEDPVEETSEKSGETSFASAVKSGSKS
jgi:hypothetical protein